jgi:uncharacterized protein (DUF1501 family)
MTEHETPEDEPTEERRPGITRRRLLGMSLAGGAAAAAAAVGLEWPQGSKTSARVPTTSGPANSSPSPTTSTTSTGSTTSGSDGILVVLTLYGGNDGLNTFIPIGNSAYAAARPTLGYSSAEAIALADGFALHPNLPKLKRLWDQQRFAIVRGVGYPNPNRSHFRSMDIWQSAVPDRAELTGWLGRWLDTLPGDPMTALALGSTVPRALIGATNTASAVPNATLKLPGSNTLVAAYKMLVTGHAADALSERVYQAGGDLLTVQRELGTILASSASDAGGLTSNLESPGSTTPASSSPAGSTSPSTLPANNPLATQLEIVARAIEGKAPTRVYGVSLGGFDTHAQEKQNHARLMTQLDDALGWFLDRLASTPAGHNVVLMAHSEFGRRVAENASGGTDHGAAAPVFVFGSRVRSGFHGDEPSLTSLDGGDLIFTTDFRSVYASMLQQVLHTDSDRVLGGHFTPLELVS